LLLVFDHGIKIPFNGLHPASSFNLYYHSRFGLIGTQRSDLCHHFMNGLGEPDAVTGADPGQPEPFISKAELGKDLFEKFDPPPGLEISVDIMAVSGMTSTDQDRIGALKQGLDHIFGVDHTGTHDPNQPHIGRISQPGGSGQIRSGVSAPVANKSNDCGFEVSHDPSNIFLISD
jgi:hypothetical protein